MTRQILSQKIIQFIGDENEVAAATRKIDAVVDLIKEEHGENIVNLNLGLDQPISFTHEVSFSEDADE